MESQAEIRVDLDAIRHNVTRLRSATAASAREPAGARAPGRSAAASAREPAEVMAVVKGDGYGHGMLPVARAALEAGATWLGGCTLPEALALRAAGIEAPVLAWLLAPGLPLHEAVDAGVDLSAATLELLAEVVTAAKAAGQPAQVHLKLDTGLNRGGATAAEWPALLEAAARAQDAGALEVVGVWSHLARADEVGDGAGAVDTQITAFREGLEMARGYGIVPRWRHIANSAATLTRPDAHFDLVRPGIAVYGLSPVPGRDFGLRPAMTLRARVVIAKRVPAGSGVSYGHTYTTSGPATLAVVPLGYADGIPRAASNRGLVRLGGATRTIAGRVCMDQFVLDCAGDEVHPGDVATLFGPGDSGEPTADDWADAAGTINYEIVTRMSTSRVPRVYHGASGRS